MQVLRGRFKPARAGFRVPNPPLTAVSWGHTAFLSKQQGTISVVIDEHPEPPDGGAFRANSGGTIAPLLALRGSHLDESEHARRAALVPVLGQSGNQNSHPESSR
jgi:hypothetical protein